MTPMPQAQYVPYGVAYPQVPPPTSATPQLSTQPDYQAHATSSLVSDMWQHYVQSPVTTEPPSGFPSTSQVRARYLHPSSPFPTFLCCPPSPPPPHPLPRSFGTRVGGGPSVLLMVKRLFTTIGIALEHSAGCGRSCGGQRRRHRHQSSPPSLFRRGIGSLV